MALDVNNLDLKRFENWPMPLQAVSWLALCALIVFLGWYTVIDDQMTELESLENKETKLREEFSNKAKMAVNLNQYKEQIAELESVLDAQLRQLPNSNEVANLLDDISFIAQDNGLNLVSIKWEPEVKQEIYTELPMSINVVGTYEQLGSFAADLAALPRIVTIAKFDLAHVGADKDKNATTELLNMNMLAKTFRYNEDDAKKARESRENRNQRRGRR